MQHVLAAAQEALLKEFGRRSREGEDFIADSGQKLEPNRGQCECFMVALKSTKLGQE